MRLCSKYPYLFLLLFVFVGMESWKYGIRHGINSLFGISLGQILVSAVSALLRRLDKKVYEGLYYRLGTDILYELLFGKRGNARQFFSVFILVSTPIFLFNYHSSNVEFWLFIVPMSLIATIIARYKLQKEIRRALERGEGGGETDDFSICNIRLSPECASKR